MINKDMLHLGKERSAIRELFEQGKILKERYGEDKVFDFSIGNPFVPSPIKLNDTLIKLINDDRNDHDDMSFSLHGYTSAAGDKSVRSSIASYLNDTYKAEISPDYVYVSVGAAAGLAASLRAIISNPDDEVIIFAPFFPEYKVFINNAGAKAVEVAPDYNTFYPDLSDFRNKLTKKTSAIIVNSPNNPTGILYKANIIEEISNILKEKEREYNHSIYLISDEPYRELIYDDTATNTSVEFNGPIKGYNKDYIKVNESNKYAIYDFDGKKVNNVNYKFIEIYDDFYVAVNDSNSLALYKYNNDQILSDEIKLYSNKYTDSEKPAFKLDQFGFIVTISVLKDDIYTDYEYDLTTGKRVEG